MSWYVFIYDHTVLKGNEETDPDPFEAIRLFYPPTTKVQKQHELCSQLMGVSKFMDHLLKCKPKVFHLGEDEQKSKVACIHSQSGRFTFVYGSNNLSLSGDCVYRHARILYDLIICYYGCFECIFSDEGESLSTERITDLVSSVARFQALVTFSDKTLPAIFQPIPQHSIVDSFTYQQVTVFLENLSGYEHVMGGCILYNKAMISSHLPLKIASKFLLIKSYYIESPNPSKKIPDFLKSAQYGVPIKQDNVMLLRCHFVASDLREMGKQMFYHDDECSQDSASSDHNMQRSCCTSEGYEAHPVLIINISQFNLILVVLLNQSLEQLVTDDQSTTPLSKFVDKFISFFQPACNKIGQILSNSDPSDHTNEMDSTIPSDALVFDHLDQSLTVNNVKTGSRIEDKSSFTVFSYSQIQLDEAVGGMHDKLMADPSLESITVISNDIGCLRVKKKDGNKEIYEVLVDDKI